VRRLQRHDRLAEPARRPGFDLYITTSRVALLTRARPSTATRLEITDQLNFDAGLRWNEDQKTASVYQATTAAGADPASAQPAILQSRGRSAGFFPDPGVVTDYDNTRAFVNITPLRARLPLDRRVMST